MVACAVEHNPANRRASRDIGHADTGQARYVRTIYRQDIGLTAAHPIDEV
jgi:hypothetical protein